MFGHPMLSEYLYPLWMLPEGGWTLYQLNDALSGQMNVSLDAHKCIDTDMWL